MATHSQARTGMTLEEFLRWPRIDEKPYLEYFDGRIEVKVSPQNQHSIIEYKMSNALNAFAGPDRLGFAFPELRCTFAGRSIIPDVAFLLDRNILCDDRGEVVNEMFVPPDIHIEIRSPRQAIKKTRGKIEHALANGCPLGWYIDPERREIEVYRPGRPIQRLSAADFLDGEPVLPGFRVAFTEVFGWLIYRIERPDNPGAGAR